MRTYRFVILSISLFISLAVNTQCWAQISEPRSSLKELSVNYNELRLDKGYAIQYDNPNAAAKLNEFKIRFFKDGTFVDETGIERFPRNGTIEAYGLARPVIGFNRANLSILSLYTGDIADFPSSAASIIALNEPTAVAAIPPNSTPNKAPIANNAVFEIEATDETITQSIVDKYSDPDNDPLLATGISKIGPPLSYSLVSSGALTLMSPTITGEYSFPYEVKDSQDASASAQITVAVLFPESVKLGLEAQTSQLDALRSEINTLKTDLLNLSISDELINRRETLLNENRLLEDQVNDPESAVLKKKIIDLTQELETSIQTISAQSSLEKLENLESQLTSLQSTVQSLKNQSLQNGVDINTFETEIEAVTEIFETVENEKSSISVPTVLTSAQMEGWEKQHQILKGQVSPHDSNRGLVLLGALVFLAGAVSLLERGRRKRAHSKIRRKILSDIDRANINLLNSLESKPWSNIDRSNLPSEQDYIELLKNLSVDERDILAAELSKSLSQQLTPDVIEDILSRLIDTQQTPEIGDDKKPDWGQLGPEDFGYIFEESLSEVYLEPTELKSDVGEPDLKKRDLNRDEMIAAVGRIGPAFNANLDGHLPHSRGTGILISKKHVLTNWHVFQYSYHYLVENDEDGRDNILWGIDFLGYEDDPSASDFHKFDGNHPIYLPNLDLAIFTLAEEISDRSPMPLIPIDAETYMGRDITLVGYPDPHGRYQNSDIIRQFGFDAKFGIKRLTTGIIERPAEARAQEHTYVYNDDNYGDIPVIGHKASAVSGNSGGPLLDDSTHKVLGVHFRGAHRFMGTTLNLAMPTFAIVDGIRGLEATISTEKENTAFV